MSDPAPAAPQPPQGTRGSPGKRPVLVVPGYGKREILIAVLLAIAVLGMIVFAVFKTGTDRSPNLLRGVVVGKYDTGERETLLNVSSKGVKGKTADTGLYLKVRVDTEGKIYDVMVSELDWNRHKDGDKIDFIRPRSEQR
jgi:hypothetical protein